MLFFSKNKRLVSEAESVGKHHHHHRYLEASLIDTYLLSCLDERTRIYVGEYDFVYRLIHYAGNTKHKQRQGVTKHLAEQSYAETPLKGECLLIVEGASQDVEEKDEEDLFSEIQSRIQQGMKKNQAIKEVAKLYQWNKSQLYAAYHDWEENQEND